MENPKSLTYSQLLSLLEDIQWDERDKGVRFGCSCGCGGNNYTHDSWDAMCDASDKAREALKSFGVIFEEDE